MSFVNPLSDPLFAPTAYRMLALLGVALVLLLITERRRLRPIAQNVLLRRWFSWAVLAPLYLCGILSGVGAITVLIAILTFQGLREYAGLVQLPPNYRRVLIVMGLVVAPMAAVSVKGFYMLGPLLLILATLQPLLFGSVKSGVRQLAFAALGWGYISWFLAHIILLARLIEGGVGIVLAILAAVGLSDVGAFAVGTVFGKHKLSPRLSPGKTVEGAIGNFLGAFAGATLMSFALPHDNVIALMIVLTVLVGAGAIWGDLVESAIKREFGAKDAGTWLPGFGGILDRIDSLIIVAPLAYYFLAFTA